jgi:hypothetical protein
MWAYECDVTMLCRSSLSPLNRLADFHEIWYGHCAIGGQNMVDARNCEAGLRLAPLNIWSSNDVWYPKICLKNCKNFGFEILTAVTLESSIFWDITPCSPAKVNRRFGGICHLHFQGLRLNQAENQQLAACFMPVFCLKMKMIYSTEESVDFHWTTWVYIPEDRNL